MANDDNDDPKPVPFEQLRKQWQQKESGTKPQQEPAPVIPDTPPLKPPAIASSSSTVVRDKEPIPKSTAMAPSEHPNPKAPPIPPKPSVTPCRTPPPPAKLPTQSKSTLTTAESTEANDQRQKVSLLAQQFEKQKATQPQPQPPTAAAATTTTNTQPRPVEQADISEDDTQDPFCDDEEVSDSSDSDASSSETNSTSSGDSEMDDRLVHQVQMRYAHGASSSGSLESVPARTPPPPPKDAMKKAGTPPPPPPPSKKYHSSVRRPQTAAVNIPDSQPTETITGKQLEMSPPVLPPRPSISRPTEGMPILPPRPSTSTLARSHTIGTGIAHQHHHHSQHNVPLPDNDALMSHSMSSADYSGRPRRSQSTRTPSARRAMSRSQMQMTNKVYPDATNASRKKPVIGREKLIPTGHRGAKNAVAISGPCLATGAHETRIWDTQSGQCCYTIEPNGQSEANDKVSALEFAPTADPHDEGRFLWVGLKDSDLLVIDARTGKIWSRPGSTHKQAIIWILRYKNTELWTIDEAGVLNIWDVMDGNRLVGEHLVMPRASAALLVGRDLWMATGRTFEVHRFGNKQQIQQPPPRIRITNGLGNIIQLAVVPYHIGKIFMGHENGDVSVWDMQTVEQLEVISVSMYAISCMVPVGEYYLWMGFNTGMIYVYDTRPERWLVVKVWKAHSSGVSTFVVDDIGLALGDKTVQIISVDSHGYVSFWDGLMEEHWRSQQMEKFRADYSVEQDTRILICSWNIDANKPGKLSYSDDLLVREWLSGMRDPDPEIIVVGIQEIVDLESKKQTARSLFASRKKIETLQEADELLTHRYTLWHDYLVQVIADNYGRGAYTVIKTDQLVGLFSCIFVRSTELRRISYVDSKSVKTGMKVMKKSLHGNKGGIAIRFRIDDSSLCFVNCHLAAGQSHYTQRNADAEGILKDAQFPAREEDSDAYPRGGDGTFILDHEHCFLSGDLNYRIDMHREEVLQYLASRSAEDGLAYLQKEDQLLKQREANPFFKLMIFQESPIHFLPTYKYDPGKETYDSSEKRRVPAWCDRILYRSNSIQSLFYQRHEVLASDHRPISGGYIVRVKRVDPSKKAKVAYDVDQAWRKRYTQLVQEHKANYVAGFDMSDAVQRLEAANWDVNQIKYR